jgi:hypothetical protein
VWSGSNWASGAANQYPWNHASISSYTVLDEIIKYYNNAALYPNLKHIVIAGHSLGGQTVHRYAAVGNQLGTRSTHNSFWPFLFPPSNASSSSHDLLGRQP